MATNYRHIGKRLPRKDANDIVRGRSKYINDLTRPGMLYAKVLRSPHPHANLKSIDTSKAESLPGVRSVLTYKNAPNWMVGLPPSLPVLDKKVRYVGDAVALVAARTAEIAEEACNLIRVEYEVLPAAYDPVDATKAGATPLYAQFPKNVLPPGCPPFGPNALTGLKRGDVEQGFQEADVVTEGLYAYEGIANPLPPEPPGVIVEWTGANAFSIWSSNQSPSMIKWKIQGRMGFPDIRSFGGPTGGGYGSKNSPVQLIYYTAALAKASGRPVKLVYTKKEHFDCYVLRLGSRIRGKVGMKKDGTVTAMSGDWTVNTGVFSENTQGQVAVGCGHVQLMLRCSNWDLKNSIVVTNRNASGIIRGFGGQELKSSFLPILTLAMEKAGIDPLAFYGKNFIKPGDKFWWRDGIQYTYRGVDYWPALAKGAETFDWKNKWKGWLQPTAVNGPKRRGVGIGVHGSADVGEDTSEAWVRLSPDGRAVIFSPLSEAGMGERSSVCKMAAEVLNLPLDDVNVAPADTMINPFDFGLAGSRGTFAVGSAVISAAEDARQQLFEMAAPMLQAKPSEMETQDGQIWAKSNPQKKLPWIAVMGLERTIQGRGIFHQDFTLSSFIALFTEVEVDTETGVVELKRVLTATDVGQIIDPASLENQFNGCLGAAGLDTATFEESVLDPSTGRILTANMIDYKWRTFADLPEMQHVILETPMPTHRFGAVGVGEITTTPGPSAILMATSNAIGKHMVNYPITPDKILTALGKLQGGKA